MGHKSDPRGIRVGINKTWQSRWYGEKNYQKNLQQDILLREDIKKLYKKAAISSVEVERSVAKVKVIVFTGRPGVLIGRGGQGVEEIKKYIRRKYFFKENLELQVEIKEVKSAEENAQLLANEAAEQIERRMAFRRVMKTMLDKVMQNRSVKGIKIELSGRLGGAEMSRREWLAKGSLPLHTLRANIDFAKAIAYTTYGTIGVKVWVYKVNKESFLKA
jgi:small subunit ribosomal protein S3